jgi:hypothetical protein
MSGPQHTAAHEVFRDALGDDGRDYASIRKAWKELGESTNGLSKQKALVRKSLKAGGVPDCLIESQLEKIFEDHIPGKNRTLERAARKAIARTFTSAEISAIKKGGKVAMTKIFLKGIAVAGMIGTVIEAADAANQVAMLTVAALGGGIRFGGEPGTGERRMSDTTWQNLIEDQINIASREFLKRNPGVCRAPTQPAVQTRHWPEKSGAIMPSPGVLMADPTLDLSVKNAPTGSLYPDKYGRIWIRMDTGGWGLMN